MTRKISYLLREYFEEPKGFLKSPSSNAPVSVKACKWEVHQSPERFARTYTLDTRPRLKDFVLEVMNLEDEINHHGKIEVSHNEVTITVYTHDVNRITELDQEYTQHVDKIYRDILDFGY